MIKNFIFGFVGICAYCCVSIRADVPPSKYIAQANEVMDYIQKNFYQPKAGLYVGEIGKKQAEFMWGNGVMFSAICGAARYEPVKYLPLMHSYFLAMDRYWDAKAPIPGFEPAPTAGNGFDKYYDDNEWMVITFAEAYEMTHQQEYLGRAEGALKFALSGWDDQLGGGIIWHETHEAQSKNTCSNGPGAEGCLRVAKYLSPDPSRRAVEMAKRIVDWTNAHFLGADGLYEDSQNLKSGRRNNVKLTYNTALMIRSEVELSKWLHDDKYLVMAKRSAKAGDWFLSPETHAYRDALKWSHLMVEADLELWRTTHEQYLLDRARKCADVFYEQWKDKPSKELIENASVARTLWLLADSETEVGKKFWARSELVPVR